MMMRRRSLAYKKLGLKLLKNAAVFLLQSKPSMSQLQEQLPRALFLSYEYLPSDLKQCFLYCSLFPEDFTMDRDELIRYWVAEG